MNSYKVRDGQKPADIAPEFINEEIGIPPANSCKKKKTGASDPRFKRVINAEFRGDADADAEKLTTSHGVPQALYDQVNEDQNLREKVISFLKTPNDASLFTTLSLKKFEEGKENFRQDLSEEVTKDTGLHTGDQYALGGDAKTYRCENFQNVSNKESLKQVDKVKSGSKANLKRSASDCTLQTKKAFLDENEDEVEKVRAYPSATRLSKVHNWIKEYNILPEKRRSVITVIGQTQTKPFSKILSEINQRRKLAKELDKHALCEAIMDSAENQPEVKNLVAKVDLVLPDGKVIYSTEKVYLCKDNKFTDAGLYSQNSMEILDAGDQIRKRCEMIPERDSSVSQIGKKIRPKRASRKIVSPIKEKLEVKGKIKNICGNVSFIVLWTFLAILCLSLCFSVFFYTVKPSQTYFLVELFKPKTTAWYEKLLF